MRDKDKTKSQLVTELELLRMKVQRLELAAIEHKKIWQALTTEKSQLLLILDSIDEVIYASDPNTHEILYANQAVRDILKKEPVGEIC